MSRLKKFFFVFVIGLILGAVATLVYGTESHADNTGDYGFSIVHSTECSCGNNNVSGTVILGSTHTYTIMPRQGILFKSAVWGIDPEPSSNDPNIDIPLEEMGKSITIHFVHDQKYTLRPTMTDSEGKTYNNSLEIAVVDDYFKDAFLNICTMNNSEISITPQFMWYTVQYPDGALTYFGNSMVEWDTDTISFMNPEISSNNVLTVTPTKSGEYTIYARLVDSTSESSSQQILATTSYTIFIPEKEVNVGQSISSTGQQNEYVYFTPDATGRYKINWKSYSNSGYESLYDSDGNQVSRVDDYLGGYWLTEDETYFMKLRYSTPTNSNSYSIDLYDSDDNDDSDSDPSDNNPGGDNGSSSKPDKNPPVPSGQPSQGISAGGGNSGNPNSGAAVSAPTQKISVAKVKGKPKLKLKKGKIKLTFKKVRGADGYEVLYATNKKFKKSKKVTVKAPKATLKKLKKGKKYFVKVRAFKRDASSQKVYGAYSKVVKLTVR